MKFPATAERLIAMLGERAAMAMMESSAYGGKEFDVPKGELGRGEQTFAALAEVIGMDGAKRLCEHFGGDCIYVPLLDKLRRAKRNRIIVTAYNRGSSVWQLASEYAMTERQVRNILKRTDMEDALMGDSPQQDLF